MANQTKTPRTDRVAIDGWSGDAVAVPYEFAQKLERENKRLRAELRKLKVMPNTVKINRKQKAKDNDAVHDAIKRAVGRMSREDLRLHHDAHDDQRMHNQVFL